MRRISLYTDAITLLRIPFSLLLMPVFLLALSQSAFIDPGTTIWTFAILHLLVYPASNGYNSYEDRDTSSIGGLENPPPPNVLLYYLTLLMDALAIALSWMFVGHLFAGCILAYIIASRAYSARTVRLKRYPVPGFLTVVFFQGAFTYFMCWTGIHGELAVLPDPWLMAASSFQIAAFYPLTQIYQHETDRANGDRSISMMLGYRGTFMFSGAMTFLAGVFYFMYFFNAQQLLHFFVLLVFLLPSTVQFVRWFRLVNHSGTHADFHHTMRMSTIASACMSCCFILLLFLRR
jgi:4-hydroxybenzoate polyprenyltransferase